MLEGLGDLVVAGIVVVIEGQLVVLLQVRVALLVHLPDVDVGLRQGFRGFLVVADGVLAVLLHAEAVLVAVAQLDQRLGALVAGGLGVVEQGSLGLLGHPVATFVHDAQEVVGVGIVLLLGDDLPAVHVDLVEIVHRAPLRLAEHELDVLLLALHVALLGGSLDEPPCLLLVLGAQLALQVDDPQVVQGFHVFGLGGPLEVLQTLALVFVLGVVEVEGCQVVERPGEVLLHCLRVVLVGFLGVGLDDLPAVLLQPVLVQVAQVGHRLQVPHSGRLLP